KQKKFDEGLLDAVAYVEKTLDKNIGKQGERKSLSPGGGSTTTKSKEGGMGIGGWICIGLVAVLAIWLVVGLIRAFTSPRPGPGYGPGGPGYAPGPGGAAYGAPAGGGGGGGFFSSLLGG